MQRARRFILILSIMFTLLFSFTALAEEVTVNQEPAVTEEAAEMEAEEQAAEVSLGTFTITGYCGCTRCSGGHLLTYSGTVPQAEHTISADLTLFPLGTRLKIDDIIYTVEDMGSSVNGNILDIYYDSHEAALESGTYEAEVFLIEE